MERLGINLSLTLSNHFFNQEMYRESSDLLNLHHRPGNSLTLVSDKLARRIRSDFPDYTLIASLIKNINTLEKTSRALELYDYVVVPMDKNDDDGFLASLPEKKRIILFGNASCAYNCPARTCYVHVSRGIQNETNGFACSKDTIPRPELGFVYFDIDKLYDMGFAYFKLVPDKTEQLKKESIARFLTKKRATTRSHAGTIE